MIKWIAFGLGSLVWVAVCWFFASMVALSEAGPKASIAQDACAKQLILAARAEGREVGRMDALYTPQCRAEHDRVMTSLSRPYLRNGLLIGFGPVLLLGLLMFWRRG
ncbi:hypothetical protein ACFOMD_13245 [Sphingoaurantiacus capsulatus]|uniref:Lipoprotein n=1 Tax=Sphingoaurantiacus capsulatus TaxID=1771310 RepID=A0ABV7XEP0_9SPHN